MCQKILINHKIRGTITDTEVIPWYSFDRAHEMYVVKNLERNGRGQYSCQNC